MSRRAPRSSARTAVPFARQRSTRWRKGASLLLVACLAVGVVAAFGRDLVENVVAGAFPDSPSAARPLTTAEAERLARMRQLNWEDGQAGVRARIGEGDEVHAVGWVDWQRPAVYLALSGEQPGVISELVQAVPGLVATRPAQDLPAAPTPAGTPGATPAVTPAVTPATTPEPTTPEPTTQIIDPHPPPPREPPVDGWRIRQLGADGPAGAPTAPGTIDTLLTLLFSIGADSLAAADVLARSDARWLGRDRTAGYDVDVLLGPAVPPTTAPPAAMTSPATPPPPASLAEMGGAVRYWLDDDARLHRLDARLAAQTPVRVDLDRADRTAPEVLDLLGGAATEPRPLTEAETALLSELPQRNRAAGGGEITVTLPERDGTVRGTGWLDWQHTVAYLTRTTGRAEGTGLLWADQRGVAHRTAPAVPDPGADDPAADAPAADDAPAAGDPPPVPAPPGPEWQRSEWEERGDELGGFDLDLLINEALALSGWEPLDPALLTERARWLRADRIGGDPVQVYELPREFEARVSPGQARMRYWVDGSGVLRRLEIRTRTGGFGQLDLKPGPVPYLGSAP